MLPKARLEGDEVKAEIPPGLALAYCGVFAKVLKVEDGGEKSVVGTHRLWRH